MSDGSDTSPRIELSDGPRRFHPVQWDTVFQIGGAVEDTTLLLPRKITAQHQRLYVFDYGDSRVKAFDTEGQLRWASGQDGRGPGEFMNALDLKVGPDGVVWVVDGRVGRITGLSADGAVQRIIPFHGEMIKDVVPGPEEILATAVSPTHFAVALDEGGVRERLGFPVSGMDESGVSPTVRQTVSAASPDGRSWSAVFPMGDLLLIFDGRQLRCAGHLVEGEGFPKTGEDQPIWAVSVAWADSSVFVLGRGTTEHALRVVDEYSTTDCSYRRSLRLPQEVSTMAFSSGTFYFGHENPAPTILALVPAMR